MRRALVVLLLAGCDGPMLSLAERIVDGGPDGTVAPAPEASQDAAELDRDADIDEDFIPCSSAAQCPDPRDPDEGLCNLTRGECVECLSDADCPAGETCDADGDCDD